MYKIAVIDDEKDIVEFLQRFLSRSFDVTVFLDPLAAISEVLEDKFDLVLCDIMMPQINGMDLLKRVREKGNETKFIMMTAYDTLEKALEAHKLGADDYLKKPFENLKFIQDKINEKLVVN